MQKEDLFRIYLKMLTSLERVTGETLTESQADGFMRASDMFGYEKCTHVLADYLCQKRVPNLTEFVRDLNNYKKIESKK